MLLNLNPTVVLPPVVVTGICLLGGRTNSHFYWVQILGTIYRKSFEAARHYYIAAAAETNLTISGN